MSTTCKGIYVNVWKDYDKLSKEEKEAIYKKYFTRQEDDNEYE